MVEFSGAQVLVGAVDHLTLSDPPLLREQSMNGGFGFFPPLLIGRSHVNNSQAPKES